MEIDKNLLQEIKNYCKLNGIKDVKSQVNSCLRYGFNVLRFGDNPFSYHNPIEEGKITEKETNNQNGININGGNPVELVQSVVSADDVVSEQTLQEGVCGSTDETVRYDMGHQRGLRMGDKHPSHDVGSIHSNNSSGLQPVLLRHEHEYNDKLGSVSSGYIHSDSISVINTAEVHGLVSSNNNDKGLNKESKPKGKRKIRIIKNNG